VALRDTEATVEKQSLIYQGRRNVLIEGLHRMGWEASVPKAGMFVWAKIPEPWASQMNSIDFAMHLLENANVAVSPGGGFGPSGEGYLRMSLVENEARLRQAVRHIAQCLDRKVSPQLQTV
jgi:alanine-synthesizing transaminase